MNIDESDSIVAFLFAIPKVHSARRAPRPDLQINGWPPTITARARPHLGRREAADPVTDSISGTITRTYDLLGRLTQETTPQGTVNYTYDAASRRTSMTVTGQPTVTYAYAQ